MIEEVIKTHQQILKTFQFCLFFLVVLKKTYRIYNIFLGVFFFVWFFKEMEERER